VSRRSKGGVVLGDGPAAGRFSVRRAPYFLRAVVDEYGKVDILDQLNDEPARAELVYVYEADGPLFDPDALARTGTFLCPPPAASGRYRHRPDVDGQTVRTTVAWRAWARAQPAPEGPTLLDGVTLEARP
jgi:hypothetical protein